MSMSLLFVTTKKNAIIVLVLTAARTAGAGTVCKEDLSLLLKLKWCG